MAKSTKKKVEYEIDPEKKTSVKETSDGGALVDLDAKPTEDAAKNKKRKDLPFDANLADGGLDEEELADLSSELFPLFEADLESCEEWRDQIEQGLKLLGLKIEELDEPFEGACGATYPLIQEAAFQFQARALAELLPATGPVKTKIMGKVDDLKIEQSTRVRDYMNYQCTEQMEEYFDETDRMLLYVALVGSAFKKLYYDTTLGRPVSMMVMPQDFVISYDTTDHRTCGRYSHLIDITENDLNKRIEAGMYADVELNAGGSPRSPDDITEEIDELEGRTDTYTSAPDRYRIVEMHVDVDLPGFEDDDGIALPYIISFDHDSQKVLSIRRNWKEEDPLRRKLQWFTHYRYLPGLRFFGIGLIGQLGNLQKSITSSMRIMIDAGQFNTLPAGFKAFGVKFTDADVPVGFGEWRDVQGFGDDITKSLVPLPTKEPSQTLFQLYQDQIAAGRRLAAIGDMPIAEADENIPVGSTIAILEQNLRVMSSIHKRLHKAQHEELKILFRINGDSLPDLYPYDVEGASRSIMKEDFSDAVAVIPQSDPNVFSEAQRIMRNEAVLRMVGQAPQLFDQREAFRRMFQTLEMENIDRLLPPDTGPPYLDPLSENGNLMKGLPVMAYPEQDHDAHIAVLDSLLQDPELQQLPQAPQIISLATAHKAEHMAHKIRLQVEAALNLPQPPMPAYSPINKKLAQQQILPPELENEVSRLQAMALQQLTQLKQQAMQAQQMMQQQQQQGGMPPGQLQIEQQRLQIEQQKVQNQAQNDQMKHQANLAKTQADIQRSQTQMSLAQQKSELEREKMALEMRIKELEAAQKQEEHQSKMGIQHVQTAQQLEHDEQAHALDLHQQALQTQQGQQSHELQMASNQQALQQGQQAHQQEVQANQLAQQQGQQNLQMATDKHNMAAQQAQQALEHGGEVHQTKMASNQQALQQGQQAHEQQMSHQAQNQELGQSQQLQDLEFAKQDQQLGAHSQMQSLQQGQQSHEQQLAQGEQDHAQKMASSTQALIQGHQSHKNQTAAQAQQMKQGQETHKSQMKNSQIQAKPTKNKPKNGGTD